MRALKIEMKYRATSYAQPQFVRQEIYMYIYLRLDYFILQLMCVFWTVLLVMWVLFYGRFSFTNFEHDFSLSDKFTLNKSYKIIPQYRAELLFWFCFVLYCFLYLGVISLGTRTVPFLYAEESLNYAKCSYALNGYTPLTLLVVEEQLNFHSVSISMKLYHGPKKLCCVHDIRYV